VPSVISEEKITHNGEHRDRDLEIKTPCPSALSLVKKSPRKTQRNTEKKLPSRYRQYRKANR